VETETQWSPFFGKHFILTNNAFISKIKCKLRHFIYSWKLKYLSGGIYHVGGGVYHVGGRIWAPHDQKQIYDLKTNIKLR